MKTFPFYLANLRDDFSAAAFFADPFLYYSAEEMQETALYEDHALPERISHHFEKYFNGDKPSSSRSAAISGRPTKTATKKSGKSRSGREC